MKVVKCGIIGCGVIAPSHIESLRHLPGVEVTAVCDLVASKAESIASRYGIGISCADYRRILAMPDIDCVAVCTDHASHGEIVCAALAAGKHVICEKPLSLSAESLNAMLLEHSSRQDLVFAGIFQHRFEEVNRYIRELIDNGTFGTVSAISLNCWLFRSDEYYRQDKWRGTWNGEGGSLLINQAIHYIDLIDWISGGVKALCSCCENINHRGVIETEDTAGAVLKFRRGMVGTLTATSSSVEEWRNIITVDGSAGHLEIINNHVSAFRFGDPAVHKQVAERLRLIEAEKENHLSAGKIYYGNGHAAQLKDFIESIREKRQPYVTAASAAKAVEIVLACYESGRKGCWVELAEERF